MASSLGQKFEVLKAAFEAFREEANQHTWLTSSLSMLVRDFRLLKSLLISFKYIEELHDTETK